ncbi:MAG: DUF748 domain-containing protein, partial [Candidatus Omnitrophica bacterium]|nr:DUF748 domain-containing protein [Candidatus Omnitrophota bacterium]
MKKLLIIAVIIVGVLTGAAYFFNNVLPVKIEQLLKGYVKETLGQEIEIARIAIHPLKGVLLDGVTLYEKGTKAPALKIARVQTFPFLPSLLTKKKIFLYLGAQNVYCHVKRNEDGTLDLPAFTQQPENGLSFFVNNAEIKNLDLDFEDTGVKFRRRFSGINLSANFFVPSDIRYKLSWDKKIVLKGKYNLSSGTVKANLTMHDCNLQALNPYIDAFALRSAYVRKAQLTIAGKKSYRINGNAVIENIFIVYPLKDLALPVLQPRAPGIEAKGNLTVTDGRLSYAAGSFSYRLNAALEKGEFKNLPFIDTVTQTQAVFSLDEKTLR